MSIAATDYHTANEHLGTPARICASLRFYAGVVPIVLRASRCAKRGQYDDARWIESSRDILRVVERSGTSVHFENHGLLARLSGACVFVGNHMSTAETFLLPGFICPVKPVTFVVKRALVEVPIFKHVMISRDPVVVGRENPREDLKAVLGGGVERLRKGISIVVFPQRTRMAGFNPEGFNTIGVKLAKRAGVPVVPLALKTDAWSNGRKFKDFGPYHAERPMHFAFGEPIAPGVSDHDANQIVIEFIQQKLAQWTEADAQVAGAR